MPSRSSTASSRSKEAYLNSYLLHGPASNRGLTEADWEEWRAMEALQKAGAVKLIGISNVGYDPLQLLVDKSDVKPALSKIDVLRARDGMPRFESCAGQMTSFIKAFRFATQTYHRHLITASAGSSWQECL